MEATDDGVRLRVWVKPRASKSRVAGVRDGALEVAVAAPPVDGEANSELIRFVARLLSVPKSSVRVASGLASRHKTLAIAGIGSDRVREVLSAKRQR